MSRIDFRTLVRNTLGDRSVYWLAKTSAVPQATLAEWLGDTTDSIGSAALERILDTLGIRLSSPQRAFVTQRKSAKP